MIINRRSFLTGLLAAPIIVRAGLIMPVKPLAVATEFVGVPGTYKAAKERAIDEMVAMVYRDTGYRIRRPLYGQRILLPFIQSGNTLPEVYDGKWPKIVLPSGAKEPRDVWYRGTFDAA